ncbi:MAG: twin-arginine translocation signal domain-containing protein, partial [Smithella sp.]
MAKGNNSEYRKRVDKYYKDLMKHCQLQMEKVENTLPEPREDFHALLKDRGISRRDFVKWTSAMTAALMLPPIFKPLVAKAAENFSRLPII